MKTIKYFIQAVRTSFKTRIGSNYSTKEHQYYNVWSGKVWFESFE